MRKFYLLGLFVIMPVLAHAQFTIDTLRHLNLIPGGGYSAIWGYTAPNGREYAILGCNGAGTGHAAGTSIVDITDNGNIHQVSFIPGPASSWREMKTYLQYAYIVTEGAGSGTQIVDLSYLPDSAHLVRTFVYTKDGTHNTVKSHTITITDGYMYLNGCANWGTATSQHGMIIFDLRSNPTNPQFINEYSPDYIHDSYVLRDTIFGSAIYANGGLYIADARNKVNIQTIGKIAYTGSGTHNSWVTRDRRYVITTDEIGNISPKQLHIWDIGNLPVIPTTSVAFTVAPSVIVHNVTVRGDFAYSVWYSGRGIQIVDMHDPLVPSLAAGYAIPGSTDLDWGIYPYFPSGKIVMGDDTNGLWVFRFSGLSPRVPVTLLRPAMNETTAVATPITFRWTKTADLNKDPHWYDVRLTGTGVDTTWRANDSVTVFSDLGRLQSGRQYTWYVTVRDEWNTTPSAQTFQFNYGPPTAAASVTVTAPNGGENWQYNTAQNIMWSSTLVDSVNISYKISPGGAWVSIANARPAATGSYAWTIPNAPTAQARVRIVSSTDGAVLDTSNNMFNILVPGLGVSRTSVNFGNVNINSLRLDTIRISNPGTATLNITGITSDSTAFTVSRASFNIPAGGFDTVAITFRPTQIRTYASTLRINGNAPSSPMTVALSGVGQNPNSIGEEGVPTTYELSQNYPNPFNPTTLIRYQIPAAAHVTMRMYNLIGQQVAELVNETQGVGRYQVTLDASSLPSGMYFYRISAGSFTETKKLTLLR